MSGSTRKRLVTILIGVVLVTLFSAGAAAGSSAAPDHGNETTGSITSVGHTNTATTADNTTYVWRHTSQGLAVETYLLNVETASASDESTVCLSYGDTATCRALGNGSSVSFEISRNATERPTQVDITLRDRPVGDRLDNESYTLHPISRLDDTDGDGLSNAEEVRLGGNLTANDTDGDGIDDGVEATAYNTSITAADTDGDGLSDAAELFEHETSPTLADTDGDGVSDDTELAAGYNATAPDTDGDGVLDGAELATGTDPTVADTDGDGVDDGAERDLGSDPLSRDTDGDGLIDGREQRLGTDPTKSDTDDDGLSDSRETVLGSDPLAADTDGDGLSDGSELERSSDPLAADTDGDGLADGAEVAADTGLLNPDSDGDGLTDGREQQLGTDPTAVDSDGDYLNDGLEATLGTDPTSRLTLAWLSALAGTVAAVGLVVPSVRRGAVGDTVDRVRGLEDALVRRQTTAETDAIADAAVAETEAISEAPVAEADEADGDDAGPASAEAVVEALPDDGLVTDSELVGEMLRAEDGRMKQSHIVEATDWSKSKVSRLLSKKCEDGDITKLRVGRENLVCLEGAQPAVVTSDPRTDTGLSPSDGAVPGGI